MLFPAVSNYDLLAGKEKAGAMRIKSPGYPSINLNQAIEMVHKLFTSSRQNVIDREAAAKDLGFTGLTGHSMKMLSNLTHFGLVEKAGKGGLRLTDVAVQLLHPKNEAEKKGAFLQAAYSPELFASIKEQWPDGFVSENALRSYLMRNGFSSVAVAPAVSSYMETYSILQQERATESHGAPALISDDVESSRQAGFKQVPPASGRELVQGPVSGLAQTGGIQMLDGERVVFVEEGGPANYLKLVANGELDETMLEALEDYIKRQKKRLAAYSVKSLS